MIPFEPHVVPIWSRSCPRDHPSVHRYAWLLGNCLVRETLDADDKLGELRISVEELLKLFMR